MYAIFDFYLANIFIQNNIFILPIYGINEWK